MTKDIDARDGVSADPASGGGRRPVWLCADDYGISPGVSSAIRELIRQGRLNATSVMMNARALTPAEASALAMLRDGSRHLAIGLHVTLTAPFAPLTAAYAPLQQGCFPSMPWMLAASFLRRLQPEKIAIEVGAQIEAFTSLFGRKPDFIDGHQHVHLFPQVRTGVLAAVRRSAPQAWIRQCGSSLPLAQRIRDPKGLLIDRLSAGFRRKAARLGLRTCPAFAGTYDFSSAPDYPALFTRFFRNLPAHGVVMCHPGHVDDELTQLDPLTGPRQKEFDFLAGKEFPQVLNAQGVTLDKGMRG